MLKQFIKDTWVELALTGVLLIGSGVMLTGVFIGATDEVDNVTVEQAEVVQVQESTPIEPVDTVTRADIEADYQERVNSGYYEALDLLAHLIYSEVGEDGEESMWYAGSVVLNRIKSNKYPDTLEDVIYQRGQYQVTWNGGLYKEEPSDIAYEVAAELLNSGSVLPSDVLGQAEFKQFDYVYDKIGRTYYCGVYE